MLCFLVSRRLQGGEVAKDPALCQVHKKVDDSASTIRSDIYIYIFVAAGSPSPGNDERLERQVAGEQHENRSWPLLWDQMRAWIAGMGAGKEPVEAGAGDGTSGGGLGQPSPAQVLTCCHHRLGIRGVVAPSNPATRFSWRVRDFC